MKDNYKIIAQNRRAGFDYFLEDEFEAGMVLLGSEIKSLRDGKANIKGAFVEITDDNECFLVNSSIQPYKLATFFNHEEKRKRKLLLNKREIKKIKGKITLEGYTCVPLVIYINHKNFAKIKIAVAKGKKLYDKREKIKETEWKKERKNLMNERHGFK
ncbi:MAG: SsrA-binding protein SmpB [Rickettsiales bacterium]|jgi:SsrA-binding protein|nr:SsrA-binding protein SmpB [Rickettsiales bacterium]